MQIPKEHLDKFIQLYEEKYGIKLDRETAYDKASRLLRFIEIVESNDSKIHE